MSLLRDLCKEILIQLQDPEKDDLINDCRTEYLRDITSHDEELFNLSNEKLHVFPFKDVEACWFRLYTDASIGKALKKIQAEILTHNGDGFAVATGEWVDEVVAILDMALIMAGGLGREEMIHKLLAELQAFVDEGNSRPAKRRRVDTTTVQEESGSADSLPPMVVSVPIINHPVERLRLPSLHAFQNHMSDVKSPVILEGTMEHWPALQSWKSKSYWLERTFGGRRLVPIEIGRSYTDVGWGQRIVPFKDFLNQHILGDSVFAAPLQSKDERTESSFELDNDTCKESYQTAYLAQHDLLRQIPSLRLAIGTPDYCFLDPPPPEPGTPVAISKLRDAHALPVKSSHPTFIPSTSKSAFVDSESDTSSTSGQNENETAGDENQVQTNIWFGPAWTISPLHHDPYHNILCQVVGKKYIRLYSPHDSERLYPRSDEEIAPDVSAPDELDIAPAERVERSKTINMSNTSTIDIGAMELSPAEDWDAVYPGISEVPFLDCILNAGDALYIPVGYWHYVRSCSVGISVSYWFS